MKIEKKYLEQFSEVQRIIHSAKTKINLSINTVLIDLYWQIGAYVYRKLETSEWGKSVVQELSDFIREKEPDVKGFSAQNIWRMRQFYEAYRYEKKLSSLVREISWTNNLLILSKANRREEREFYLQIAKQEAYSSRELERQIDSGLFERAVTNNKKLSAVLREICLRFSALKKRIGFCRKLKPANNSMG